MVCTNQCIENHDPLAKYLQCIHIFPSTSKLVREHIGARTTIKNSYSVENKQKNSSHALVRRASATAQNIVRAGNLWKSSQSCTANLYMYKMVRP